ncbi:hypothetical protein HYQ46_008737 [Verticillium longisporum]|nr:hypothetical protein HYQ46_008737 [Verticillium longisporum]
MLTPLRSAPVLTIDLYSVLSSIICSWLRPGKISIRGVRVRRAVLLRTLECVGKASRVIFGVVMETGTASPRAALVIRAKG